MTEVLEHLYSSVSTLQYIKKKFRGHDLVVSVPNGGSFGRLIHGVLRTKMLYFQDRYHLCLFNETSILNVFREAEIEVVQHYFYAHSHFQATILSVVPNLSSGMLI